MLSPVPVILTGAMKLIDERTLDGSRRFTHLPRVADWISVRDHVLLLPGAEMVNFIGGEMAQDWLDFAFRGRRFLIRGHDDHFHLFVDDPQCSDLILYQVGRHFEQLLKTVREQ
ncbi:MAG: hypothetical protein KKA28_05295 [Planctomycetes bacterium]|nr:hypothetical protein [Planctomycetota bacterium]MCG2682307.1 hypothetical protein [Planctomycetales bacterium]